jgi:hypothetical protein
MHLVNNWRRQRQTNNAFILISSISRHCRLQTWTRQRQDVQTTFIYQWITYDRCRSINSLSNMWNSSRFWPPLFPNTRKMRQCWILGSRFNTRSFPSFSFVSWLKQQNILRFCSGWDLVDWLELVKTLHNSPGFKPSILWHCGIWGAADEALLNNEPT